MKSTREKNTAEGENLKEINDSSVVKRAGRLISLLAEHPSRIIISTGGYRQRRDRTATNDYGRGILDLLVACENRAICYTVAVHNRVTRKQ